MTFTRVGGGRNPPLLSPGDVLRVETNFETRSALVLAVESCWVSSEMTSGSTCRTGPGFRQAPVVPKAVSSSSVPRATALTRARSAEGCLVAPLGPLKPSRLSTGTE